MGRREKKEKSLYLGQNTLLEYVQRRCLHVLYILYIVTYLAFPIIIDNSLFLLLLFPLLKKKKKNHPNAIDTVFPALHHDSG